MAFCEAGAIATIIPHLSEGRINRLEILTRILKRIIDTIYYSFGCALMLAVLFMFLYMIVRKDGWKEAVKKWLWSFRKEALFRKVFFFALYMGMLLFITLLGRDKYMNPVGNIIGVWGIYNDYGRLTTDSIENFILFLPFAPFFLSVFPKKQYKEKYLYLLWMAASSSFLLSLTIELLQLLLSIGTFQLSDLVFNTLGGITGGAVYILISGIIRKIRKGAKDSDKSEKNIK